MIQIELNNKEKIMLVKVDNDGYDFEIVNTYRKEVRYLIRGTENPLTGGEKIIVEPLSGLKTIDKTTVLGTYLPSENKIDFEVKEQWVKEYGGFYMDYMTKPNKYNENAYAAIPYKHSFLSLLKAETEKVYPLKENPKPEPIESAIKDFAFWDKKEYIEWQEAEKKVMPKKFAVILIIHAQGR